MTHTQDEDFVGRVAKLERDVAHIGLAVDAIRKSVDTLSSRGQITWPVIFTFATAFVGVVSIGGAIHMLSLKPLETASTDNHRVIEAVVGRLEAHMATDGHPKAMIEAARIDERNKRHDAELTNLREQVRTLDDTLQREMRLLVATADAKVEALDSRLQREMVDKLAVGDVRLSSLETSLKEHKSEANHPYGVLVEVEKLRAEVSRLSGVLSKDK